MKRKRTVFLLAALGSAPLAGSLTAVPAAAATATTHTYKGSTVSTVWGPMQVIISVKSQRIVKVKVVDPTHTARSAVLADRAIPILEQETLSAQSARIDTVSGATTLSQAYVSSLQTALVRAHLG